jgi:hypothetical protein
MFIIEKIYILNEKKKMKTLYEIDLFNIVLI